MKRFALIVAFVMVASNAYAVAPQGLKTSGLLSVNGHSHVSTTPTRIYAVAVTPTTTNGFVQILTTKCARVDSATGLTGRDYINNDTILADIRGAVANQTIVVSYPYGINCERMFVDRVNAAAEIYYKE